MPILPPMSRSGVLPGGVHGLANSDGFRTAMEEQLNGKDSIADHVSQSQVCIAESQHFYLPTSCALFERWIKVLLQVFQIRNLEQLCICNQVGFQES